MVASFRPHHGLINVANLKFSINRTWLFIASYQNRLLFSLKMHEKDINKSMFYAKRRKLFLVNKISLWCCLYTSELLLCVMHYFCQWLDFDSSYFIHDLAVISPKFVDTPKAFQAWWTMAFLRHIAWYPKPNPYFGRPFWYVPPLRL